MKTIRVYVESPRGHDTLHVPQDQLQKEVESQLKNDRWVTVEKEDGNTEILAEKDLPAQEDKPGSDWKNIFGQGQDNGNNPPTTEKPPAKQTDQAKDFAKKFEKVKSVTSTMKAKGG